MSGQGETQLRNGRWRTVAPLEHTPMLAAALDAFDESGYHGTSVRDIAKRVGVTVPALYYHHENKEAVLFALQSRTIERLNEVCGAAVADAGQDVAQRFLNLAEAIVLHMARSPKEAALDAEIRVLTSEHRAAYSRLRRRIETMLVDAIEDGRGAGLFDLSDAKYTARALLGMFQAIATWYRSDGPVSPSALARRYLDIALHTVGASPALIDGVRTSNRSS